MADLTLVSAGIPAMDDCPILTRFKAFVVDQGVCATLQHTMRDRTGNPLDLSEWLSPGISESNSMSSSTNAPGSIVLRVKEWLGNTASPAKNPVWEVVGATVNAETGVVRATLEEAMVEHSAIYELNWAVLNSDSRPVVVDRSIMSVERSMFPVEIRKVYKGLGPPTLQEVRMRMMDSSRNENLLLDDIEFKDEQIMLAMWEPIRLWNESPPPVRPLHTTRTFPFRGAWVTGVMGQLHLMMAAHFRRNVMRSASGGMTDKDKEREYMAEGMRLWNEYSMWMQTKKVELNLKTFAGANPSPYVTNDGW